MIPETKPAMPPASNERPLVYGYLCAEEPDEIRIGLWRKEIGLFCLERGYRLALIFVDRGIPHGQVARTGFTGLLDVLDLDVSHGVVVPSLDHLSGDDHVFALLERLIRRTASKLIVIDEEADSGKADSA